MTSWVILPLASLLALLLAGSPTRAQTGTCPPVSNIPVQTGFDFDRFANGTRWNVIQYNKIIPIEGLDMEVVKSDVSLLFSRDLNNTMTVNLGELSATRIELYKPFIFFTSDGLDTFLVISLALESIFYSSSGVLNKNFENLCMTIVIIKFWINNCCHVQILDKKYQMFWCVFFYRG